MYNFCPICGSTENKIIGKPKTNKLSSEFIDKDYYVVKCKFCQTYYVEPTIDFIIEQWKLLYSLDYFVPQTKRFVRKRQKELVKRFNKAERFAKHNIKSFLDIGVGEGKALLEAKKRGWEVIGIDIVDNRIEEARKEIMNFIKGDFLTTNFYNNSFDFIYLDSVLEHVINPIDYLRKIKKILNDDGIIYIGVPNEDSLFNDIRKIIFHLIGKKSISVKLKPFDVPYHVVGFNKNSVVYTINKVGFKLAKIYNLGRKFEFLYTNPLSKAFWINIFFLFPVEFIGKVIKKDVYYSIYLTK